MRMHFSKPSSSVEKSQFRYLEKGVLKLLWATTIKPRKIERSVFFYWTTTDKLEFTDWGEVQRRFGSGEIAIFPIPERVKRWIAELVSALPYLLDQYCSLLFFCYES